MRVPSGRIFTKEDIHLAEQFARIKFVEWRDQPIKLKSGIMSRVYVQGRDDLTSNPDVLVVLASKILCSAGRLTPDEMRQTCFIGLPTAGTPLACAAAILDDAERLLATKTLFYQMREQRKVTHGVPGGWVIGKPMPKNHVYITLDNVITDGQTKIDMEARFAEDGFPIKEMCHIIVVDRQQGGIERLAQHGMSNVAVLFNLLDLTHAYRELGLWPAVAVEMVEREIAEHRAQQK